MSYVVSFVTFTKISCRSQRLSDVSSKRISMVDLKNANRKYKVGKVLTKYKLTDLHNKLAELWVGETGEEFSLRDLAERINVRIVRVSLERAGEDPLDGEAENVYRLLHGDDVSAGVQIQQENRLERAGIDVDELKNDFVTHQSVHTYLTKGLNVSKSSNNQTDPMEKRRIRIERLQNRLDAVVEQTLENLQNSGNLSAGDVDATVSIQVFCEDCGTQYDLFVLLQNGGCDCQD
jgi:hypothetical protein